MRMSAFALLHASVKFGKLLLPPLFVPLGLPHLLSAQSPPPGFIQFTADDGLPSSEVYEIIQDRQGYLWFGTDNGVSRFNGYEFENFGALQGLGDPVVFGLQEDRWGRIWMQTMSGRLYYYEKDSIYAFAGNQALDSLKERQINVTNFFVVDSLGQIYSYIHPVGLLRFSPDGEGEFLIKDLYSFSVFLVEDKAIGVTCNDYSRRNHCLNIDQAWNEKKQREISFYSGFQRFKHIVPAGPSSLDAKTFLFRDKTVVVALGGYLSGFWGGKLVLQTYFPEDIISWFQNSAGEIFIGLNYRKGVRRYRSVSDLQLHRYDSLLQGYSVSHVLQDREGGYWFSTTEAGVFYQPNPGMEIFNRASGLPVELATSVALINEHEAFFGLDGGGLWKVNATAKKIEPLLQVGERAFDLAYDASRNVLWCQNSKGWIHYLSGGKWHLMMDTIYSAEQKAVMGFSGRRYHFSKDKKNLWATWHSGFNKINLEKKWVEFHSNYHLVTGAGAYTTRTLDVFTDGTGRTWVANIFGLFELKNNRLVPPEKQHPAFQTRIETLDELPDSTLVIGTKGYGVIFWKGDRIASLTQGEGLTTNMIENLHVDAAGNLWAGTLNGLNKIQWHWDRKTEIETITTAHGLPTNEINKVATWGNTIWVATSKGLARFSEKKINSISPKPILKSVLADRRSLDLSTPARLTFWENNLSIHYFAINFKMNGRIPYRYRLDGDEWVHTFNTSLNFPSLPPGNRFFEVQAQNEDGVWSESASYQFYIQPPWWETWWFRVAVIMVVAVAGFAVYKYRTRQLRQEFSMRQQLTDLERKALQAQMNPHFIFNCLNSIQHFILQNERDEAIHHLGCFAKLVRGMLNASVAGKITLAEEAQLLENYLSLEKLRFKDRFDFEVRIAEGTDMFDIKLPPLLVQPYVENAVLHGIRARERGGRVEVLFQEKNDVLEVVVSDNGKGILSGSSSDMESPKAHKSVGMGITRRRLELLDHEKGKDLLSIEEIRDASGEVAGTQVILKIVLEEETG